MTSRDSSTDSALFRSDLWRTALEKYAAATHLTVTLFDAEIRAALGPVHPTPLFQLFEEAGYDPGIFTECARRCIVQTTERPPVLVAQFHGLAVVGVSLGLEGKIVGAAVGGYALVDFSQVSEIQRLAQQSGILFERVWEIARKQPPVPQQRLIVHGELLQVLGDALLRENYRTRQYEQAAAIVDSSEDAIIREDLDGIATSWNAGAERLFGFARHDMIGKAIAPLIEQDGFDDDRALLKHIRGGGKVDHHESVYRHQDHSPVQISLAASPIRGMHGEIIGISKIARDISERKRSEALLRESAARLAGQKAAFQAAMNGAPLETSLGILVRTAIEQMGGGCRSAFYMADASGSRLRHVVGMPEGYASAIDGLAVAPESLACDPAVATRQPVVIRDVFEEPRWQEWTWLALKYCYRGCWSFPVETSAGKLVGSFTMYVTEPREATARDHELAAAITDAASIIISRHQEAEERIRVEQALRHSEQKLAVELSAARQLQIISTELLGESDAQNLCRKIVDAAAVIMRSDCASMQMLHRERGPIGELHLLASRGFTPEAEKFWKWVGAESASTCAMVLRTGKRSTTMDVETCDFMAGTRDRAACLEAGIRAVQTTPLVSRSGLVVGMLSTHWRKPHEPSESDFHLFDVLARQAADLLERVQSEEMLRHRTDQLRLLLDELNHRVKNTLATVQSIAMQTLRHAPSLAEGRASFDARLSALSKAHDVLVREHWEGADLHEIVSAALAAYAGNERESRLHFGGPEVRLQPKAALALSMALHELATNAVKYGALSNGTGRIEVSWRIHSDDPYGFYFRWTEAGGPAVVAPNKRGFGSRLIERGLSQDLAGEVRLEFDPQGVTCTILTSLDEIRARAGGARIAK